MAIIITICNFWFIKHVDKSIEPLPGIRGNGCDSSQHQRTSRTNSIQNEAIATHQWQYVLQKKEIHDLKGHPTIWTKLLTANISFFCNGIFYKMFVCKFVHQSATYTSNLPRMLQLPNHRELRQNWAKSDSRGAPFINREFLCSLFLKPESLTPADNARRTRIQWLRYPVYVVSDQEIFINHSSMRKCTPLWLFSSSNHVTRLNLLNFQPQLRTCFIGQLISSPFI